MAANCFAKRWRTASRNSSRAARNAKVAPSVLANDTTAAPSQKPNSAPAERVSTKAMGNESAIAKTYTRKNAPSTSSRFSRWNSWISRRLSLTFSSVKNAPRSK